MKLLFNFFLFAIFFAAAPNAFSQDTDTLTITAQNLDKRAISKSQARYLVYYKSKSKEAPVQNMYLVKMFIEPITYKGNPAVAVRQQWEQDSVMHTAYTVLDAEDYSTLWHEYYWKHWKFSPAFDFVNGKISYEGTVPDSTKETFWQDFQASIDEYSLNWHSDLFIFSLLPYQVNVTFKIHFYDPGFGKAKDAYYTIIGSEILTTSSGRTIDCWVMERSTKPKQYQRFWINKKTHEVMKEEDHFGNWYRFKVKLSVPEN